jgi:uncharacterized protein DUF4342
MQERFTIETIKVEGGQLVDQVKRLIHEGNVRRVTIKQDEHTVVEFPLTVGVVGMLIAPMLAAVGAVAALLTNCTIEVERVEATGRLIADTPETAPEEEIAMAHQA